ncbi:hypothetical protein G9A89_015990 [Geosiphon pyriformis]|nr:hypothetical protein G9A89_015990 [Geosiphon pyriformis]
MNITIELVQKIEDNQRMHLRSILPVFAPASVMLINKLTVNLVWLLESLAQASQQLPYQRQQNHDPLVCYHCKNASQLEKNIFYAFNLIDNNHDINKLAINTSESTKKKKKAKVDFVLDPKKTPKTNKHPCQAELINNSNVTPLICKAQVADYSIDLILNSRLSVSIIVKHFLEAIERKINKSFTWPITNKAKALFDYELCELIIKYGEKPIVVKCYHWTTLSIPKQNQEEKQTDESDNDKSDNEKD